MRSDRDVPENMVFMPFCYAEAAANLLTNPALDPFGKIPEFKFCAVRGGEGRAAVSGGVALRTERLVMVRRSDRDLTCNPSFACAGMRSLRLARNR